MSRAEFGFNYAALGRFQPYPYRRVGCAEINLTKRGPEPLDFKGPGTIWIDEDYQIQFEFKLPEKAQAPYFKATVQQVYRVAEEAEDQDYFELAARSHAGDIYRGQLLYPEGAGPQDEHRRSKGKTISAAVGPGSPDQLRYLCSAAPRPLCFRWSVFHADQPPASALPNSRWG